jgi:hypothetical protein
VFILPRSVIYLIYYILCHCGSREWKLIGLPFEYPQEGVRWPSILASIDHLLLFYLIFLLWCLYPEERDARVCTHVYVSARWNVWIHTTKIHILQHEGFSNIWTRTGGLLFLRTSVDVQTRDLCVEEYRDDRKKRSASESWLTRTRPATPDAAARACCLCPFLAMAIGFGYYTDYGYIVRKFIPAR